jgi:adenylate cyclase
MDQAEPTSPTTSLRTRLLLGLFWAVLATAVLMSLASHNLLPEAPDKFTYDWRTYFFSSRASEQRNDIALVLINEDSVSNYNYNVIDRGLVASIVKGLGESGAKAIGLDFVFERPTEPAKDAALAQEIKGSKIPVVVAAIDERARVASPRSLEFQEKYFSELGITDDGNVRAGHAFFSRLPERFTTGDQVVRFMTPRLADKPTRESFASVLADLDGPKPRPRTQFIDWKLPPANGQELFTTVRVPPHKPGTPEPATTTVIPEDMRPLLKDKIVLVGAAFFDRDQHLTPLSVATKLPVAGVTIQAQIVAQLRDGRSLADLAFWEEALGVAALTFVGYVLGWRARLHDYQKVTHVGAIIVLATIGVLLFSAAHVIIPTTTLFFGWLSGVIGGHYSGPTLRRLAAYAGEREETCPS